MEFVESKEAAMQMAIAMGIYGEKYIDKYEHILNFIYWFDNGLWDCATPFKFKIDTTKTTI